MLMVSLDGKKGPTAHSVRLEADKFKEETKPVLFFVVGGGLGGFGFFFFLGWLGWFEVFF